MVLQFVFIIVLFCCFGFLATRIGRFPGKKWSIGFFLGLLILIVVNLPKFCPYLINFAVYQALSTNNIDMILVGIAGIIAIVPCLSKLSRTNTKYLVTCFLIVTLIRSSLLPAACSILNKNELSSLTCRIDEDGIYLQSTPYTCGPAALATVLNAFGISDTESNIALSTGCNSYSGTRSIDLVNYINSRYGNELTAKYAYITDIDSLLKIDALFIAEVRASVFTDHFVAIISINEKTITIGDPSYGKFEAHLAGFNREWRHKVIVIQKKIS